MSDTDDEVGSEGGAGGERPNRGDLASQRLFRRALRNGWRVPEQIKKLALLRTAEVLREKKSERSIVAAAKVVISMTHADLASLEAAMRIKTGQELEQRLAELEQWAATANLPAGTRQTFVHRHEPDPDPPVVDEHGNILEP